MADPVKGTLGAAERGVHRGAVPDTEAVVADKPERSSAVRGGPDRRYGRHGLLSLVDEKGSRLPTRYGGEPGSFMLG